MACNHPISASLSRREAICLVRYTTVMRLLNPGRWFESIGKTFSTYLSEGSFLSCIVYISFRYVQASSLLHIVVGMFLLPSTSPKLRTITAYAASAMGAKLSFAFTSVTYKAVNPQFSTFLINTCRSCFAPIKSRLVPDFGRPP